GKPAGVEIECQQLVLVGSPADVEISLPQIVRTVIPLAVRTHISAIQTKFQRTRCLLNRIKRGIISVRPSELFSIKTPWCTRLRMFCHKVHCWRWLGSIQQAVTAADELNLAYRLRQRQVVKSGETNPVTHQWQAVAEHQGELGFLRIAQASIVEIELPGRVLVSNLK